MYIQTLIALAVLIGICMTVALMGRRPRRARRVAAPLAPGATARPDVTRYTKQHPPTR